MQAQRHNNNNIRTIEIQGDTENRLPNRFNHGQNNDSYMDNMFSLSIPPASSNTIRIQEMPRVEDSVTTATTLNTPRTVIDFIVKLINGNINVNDAATTAGYITITRRIFQYIFPRFGRR